MTFVTVPPQPLHRDRPLIIAIDGPAGAGKSTIARQLAARLAVPYLDTGAMYRATALLAQRSGLEPPFDDLAGSRISALLSRHRLEVHSDHGSTTVTVDGEDISEEIRTPECSRLSSAVSALPEVRRALVQLQRQAAARTGGVIEGRDIGTVVFPDADLKVFLTASAEERARRRFEELRARGLETSYEEVAAEQQQRDLRDSSRADSPLRAADDAFTIDTTTLSLAQVVARIVEELRTLPDQCLTAVGRTP